ncbi:MAG: sigma-70 family RNA polymerase sigma factor [Ruminiclostridium sp.]|nr:sigma-70 family RNA polymerase sigma factor [Ruminiclostridium sp.]
MKEERDNSFVTEHFGLVHSIAGRFKDRGIEYEELFSVGCVGLLKAANDFDESRGLKFSTYAVPVIMGEIKQLFRDGGIIKVSRSLKELSLKATRLQEQMLKNGEEPTISVLAQRLSVTSEEISEALCSALPPVSLSYYDEDDEESQMDIPIEAPQLKATEIIALRQIIDELSDLDKRLIRYRYWGNYTQSRTAQLLGMTQVQVSRRERKLLAMIKEKMLC